MTTSTPVDTVGATTAQPGFWTNAYNAGLQSGTGLFGSVNYAVVHGAESLAGTVASGAGYVVKKTVTKGLSNLFNSDTGLIIVGIMLGLGALLISQRTTNIVTAGKNVSGKTALQVLE